VLTFLFVCAILYANKILYIIIHKRKGPAMKTISLLTVIVIISTFLTGCYQQIPVIKISRIIVTDKVTISKFNGKNYWTTTGYGAGNNINRAYDEAYSDALSHMTRHLSRLMVSNDSIIYYYNLKESQVSQLKTVSKNGHWVVKMVVIAPCDQNPKQQ
jgi:hypothetical protein